MIRLTFQMMYRLYVITRSLVLLIKGIAELGISGCLFVYGWPFVNLHDPLLTAAHLWAAFIFMCGGLFLLNGAPDFFGALPTFTPSRPINMPQGAGTSQFANRKHMKKGGIV